MYAGYRVVAWTPYGRQRTVSLLLTYMARDHQRGIVDEFWMCMNTDESDPHQNVDRQYADDVASILPWVRQQIRPGPNHFIDGMPPHWRDGYRTLKQENTGRFFWYMQDRGTIYVRFDDDIIWVHEDAITNMIDCLLNYRGTVGQQALPLAVFPIIWNNAISSWCLQKWGHVPMEWGRVQPSAVDPVGWGDPRFAEQLHGLLLHHLENDNPDACLTPKVETLGMRQQFSVSCFAIKGDEYADIGGLMDYDREEEEHWLTQHRTGVLGRCNVVCGLAQVAHYTFFTQSHYINTTTDILHRYWMLAEKLRQDVDAHKYVAA
jgi:hypothetical protein